LDHLIGPQQHRLRDRQAEGFGGLEVAASAPLIIETREEADMRR